MSGSRHRRDVRLVLAGTVVLLGLDLAGWLLWMAWRLTPPLLVGGVLWVGWRRGWHHRIRRGLTAPRPPVVFGTVVPDRTAELAAEPDDLRRQVADLEADAARHEQLIDDLEDAAGRPIEAVIATYRHIQAQSGSAAGRMPGRSR